jgi:hypothetical protein
LQTAAYLIVLSDNITVVKGSVDKHHFGPDIHDFQRLNTAQLQTEHTKEKKRRGLQTPP